ncbi:MAG TPA: HAMP domain-containing sensor histidine kinase [Planctomycetota bacterium]|nr:HAMP domain-containing sensor histidine kinase [Planctomycetota bacterium]
MTSIRFRVVFLILALALSEAIILGVIGYNSVVATAWNEAQLQDIMLSQEQVRSLNVALVRAESQARVYYFTHDNYDRTAFSADWAEVETELTSCSTVACHGLVKQPEQMMIKIRPAVERIRAEHELILHGNLDPQANQASLKVIAANSSQIIVDTNEMGNKVHNRVQEMEQKSMAARNRALLLIALTTLGTAIGAVVLGSLVVNSITHPLREVVEGVRGFAAGELTKRIPEASARETRLLAQSFNSMADSLAKYQAGLHEEIRRKDAALSRSEKLVTIGLLASSVGHELNNPLTSLLMNSKLVQESSALQGEDAALIKQIVADAERCRAITSELRRMGRRRASDQSNYDLAAQVDETLRLIAAKAAHRGVSLKRDGPTNVPCVYEREKMLQVLLNLVENAVDESPPGGCVEVRILPSPTQITIEVRDSGAGIAPENRAKIFEQFFTTKVEGLGLGLAISKHIVEDQGGKIEFDSVTAEEAKANGGHSGTTFRILLPIKDKGTAA